MSASFETYQKRRLRSSYISVVISISLVLFMVGVLGLLIINTKKGSDILKEKIELTLFIKNSTPKDSINALQNQLKKANFSRSVHFISKKQAAKDLIASTGEDFVKYLGYNPLQNAISLRLKAAYVTPYKIDSIATAIHKKEFIDDVTYDKPLIDLLTKNLTTISFWILIMSAVFTFFSVLLINSSIRLSVYAKRFIIKTMQMVGATKGFIRRPFIWRSIKLGFLGAFIANVGLGIIVYYIDKYVPILQVLDDKILLGSIFASIFIFSFLITWISTFFAAQRFLNLRSNDLYY
ncbi:MAG: ABC transporter permease [Flavobacteriales bacterium]|jgi:cell division transport system permease protein|nr:ABC transporter permease [Flavobacteriales bacterium]